MSLFLEVGPVDEYVKETSLGSWTKFKSLVESFQLEWIYRGQADASWGLSSSLERSSLIGLDHEVESRLIAEYRKALRSFPGFGEMPATTLEWLALLQHHGTPTRLIDFTESPYIAAYFAFQEERTKDSKAVAVWCVDRIRFFQGAVYYFQEIDHDEPPPYSSRGRSPYLFTEVTFDRLFGRSGLDCVMPFELSPANRRQFIQQSVFVAAMNPQKPLAEQLSFVDYQGKPIMTKLTIPSGERNTALRDLARMNITHATLFPGLDGFARALNLNYTTLATIKEMGKWVQTTKQEGFTM
jgi:hypothetical protein